MGVQTDIDGPAGGLTGFNVAKDLLKIDFSPPAEAPEEFTTVAFNAEVKKRPSKLHLVSFFLNHLVTRPPSAALCKDLPLKYASPDCHASTLQPTRLFWQGC